MISTKSWTMLPKKYRKILFLFISSLLFTHSAWGQDTITKLDVVPQTLVEESQRYHRQFNPTVFLNYKRGEHILVFEQGEKEIAPNPIEAFAFNDQFEKMYKISIASPEDRRIIPVDLLEIRDTLWLYIMEQDIQAYSKRGESHLLRYWYNNSKKNFIRTNDTIWQCDLGVAMEIVSIPNRLVLPFYKSEAGNVHLGILQLNKLGNRVLDQIDVGNATGKRLLEPSFVMFNKRQCLLSFRTDSAKVIYQSKSLDGGNKWSAIYPSTLNSPSSMSRMKRFKKGAIIVYNNIASLHQGHRNSLDLAYLHSSDSVEIEPMNLIHHAKDYFSNFTIEEDRKYFYIFYQRLLRSNVIHNDRIEMIKVLKKSIKRQ